MSTIDTAYEGLFETALLDEIKSKGVLRKVKTGETLIDIGQEITAMPLVMTGAVSVLREDEQGDELLLYYLERGDSCAMTFSCCMGTGKSEIRAVAEADTELLMIPVEMMEHWMVKYQGWRKFILDSYHLRMSELLETVDTLAFLKMDQRLMKYLRDKAMVIGDDTITTTHQEVAQDLHTSRVVVSRLLKGLEREGKIKLGRNAIKVLSL